MSKLFNVFPASPFPQAVSHCDGEFIYTKSGKKILDLTAGATSHMILGWNRSEINEAINQQLGKFSHIDYKAWRDPNCERLAEMLVDNAGHGLDKVYFCGNSGGEACEAAIKMSYQFHVEKGNGSKQWVISRDQSYHGSSSDAMSLGDRPNLEMFRPILPAKRARICEHNPIRHKLEGESDQQYVARSAGALEEKILELGAENVAAFVGETMMGGLVGDVPPLPGYWQKIREICDRYDVHLILDEVYCGTGTSGTYFCIDRDGVTPDFLFMGKTLAAGYAPLSIVMCASVVEEAIANGQGRLQHSTTHQAYSVGVAAAIAAQQIILQKGFVERVDSLGEKMKAIFNSTFTGHPCFREVRGRGLRLSCEYITRDNTAFSDELAAIMLEKHNIYISAKWHRVCFTPSLLLKEEDALRATEKVVDEMQQLFKKYS